MSKYGKLLEKILRGTSDASILFHEICQLLLKLGFKERENLQEWIANNPDSLGEELLIIQKEFDIMEGVRRVAD